MHHSEITRAPVPSPPRTQLSRALTAQTKPSTQMRGHATQAGFAFFVGGSFTTKPFLFLGDELLDPVADDSAHDGQEDGPAAVLMLEDAFPDDLGGVALEQVLGLVVLETPTLANPALGGKTSLASLEFGVVRQGVTAALVEG